MKKFYGVELLNIIKRKRQLYSGISPDAEFPLIYAEKGLQQYYLVGPGTDQLNLI